MKYALGEIYRSPNVSMIQQSVSPESYGSCISAYNFMLTGAGCLATFTFGTIVNYLKCSHDKVLIGKIIAGMCSVGYLGAITFW